MTAEQSVKAVHPSACCSTRQRAKKKGGIETVYEILPCPFPGKSNKPIGNPCLSAEAAWRSAADRLQKPGSSYIPNKRERIL